MNDFSLFETMRYTPGEGIARLNLHLKRLETSARRLGFRGAEKAGEELANYLGLPPSALPGISPARGEIDLSECRMPSPPLWGRWRQPEGVFTANVEKAEGKTPPQPSPQGGGRATAALHPISPLAGEGGAAPASRQRLRLELSPSGQITITSVPFTLQTGNTVWRIAIANTRTASTDTLVRHKTTRRGIYEAARAEFPADTVNEVILLNEKGELAEGTITNLFVEMEDGRLATPPLSSGCLAGVLRTSLICAKRAFNQRLQPDDLLGRTIYVGNSLRGLIRAELVEA